MVYHTSVEMVKEWGNRESSQKVWGRLIGFGGLGALEAIVSCSAIAR